MPIDPANPAQPTDFEKLLQQLLADPEAFNAQVGPAFAKPVDQSDMLREQLAQVRAESQPLNQTHASGAAGAFGALGDVLRGIGGQIGAARLNRAQLENAQQVAQQQQAMATTGARFKELVDQANAARKAREETSLQELRNKPEMLRLDLSAPEREKTKAELAELQRRQAAMADPNSTTSQLRRQVGTLYGAQLAPDTAGNAIDDKELELLERGYTAKQLATLRYGPGAISGYSPEAIDTMATQILKTGHMPQFGPGATGAALRQAVVNRVSELAGAAPGQRAVPDLATAQAAYGANVDDLKEATKTASLTDVNENKALSDIQVLEQKMSPVFDSRSPWLNAVGRKLQEGSGNPDVAAFLTARQALVAQVNKVLNAGNLTESGRKEAEDLLKSDASIAQIKSVLDVLRQDMARSAAATHNRVNAARARISGKPSGPAPEDAVRANAAAPSASQVVTIRRKLDGMTKTLPAADAQRFLQSPDFEAVP
jgi:hypothetical protein